MSILPASLNVKHASKLCRDFHLHFPVL